MLTKEYINIYNKEKTRVSTIIKDTLQPGLTKCLLDRVTSLLAEYPQFDYFRCRLYKPFFNDGEECVYEISSIFFEDADSDFYMTFKDDRYVYFESTYEICTYYNSPKLDKHTGIKDFIYDIQQQKEMFEEIFGDVIISFCRRDGLKIEEYTDHE